MAHSNIGVNIIEILTTGMYKNARTIFREYVQNSCDAIDSAVKAGILAAGEGSIKITIKPSEKYICIEDDGTGIAAVDFKETLKNIGKSRKASDSDKGFRGIGRLCGFAYCDEMIFTSKVHGDKAAYSMTFDTARLRGMFYKGSNDSADDALSKVASDVEKISSSENQHGFKVELFGVNNAELLTVDSVRDYLSFVAPVKYSESFRFREKIYAHAKSLNFKIDEYKITVNGEAVVKNYGNSLHVGRGADEFFDVSFRDFRDGENLLAWGWIGLSGFKGEVTEKSLVKHKENKMCAIRLRKHNIQIGDETELQRFFKEPRGTFYFVGEIFAADSKLIPNSRRDYFVEEKVLEEFEDAVRDYFVELHKLYHHAADISTARRAIKKFNDALDKFNAENQSLSSAEIAKAVLELDAAELKARRAKAYLDATILNAQKDFSTDISKVTRHLLKNPSELSVKSRAISSPPHVKSSIALEKILAQLDASKKSKRELGAKILDVICDSFDEATSEILLENIFEALNEA